VRVREVGLGNYAWVEVTEKEGEGRVATAGSRPQCPTR